jgi:hypothetical protein
MQFSKKSPDFEITCLDGVAKTHLLLVQNITEYFTHEKPFLECNMVAVNYIMDVLYYDIAGKNIAEYKLTTMDVEAIISVCGILNISEATQKIILRSMFRDDIYADIENTMINSLAVIVNHDPKLIKVLSNSKLAKDKKIRGNLEIDVLRTITKNAITTKTDNSLKPIYDTCPCNVLASLAIEYPNILDPDLIRTDTCMFLLDNQYNSPIGIGTRIYDNLMIKLDSDYINRDISNFGILFAAVAKYLQSRTKWDSYRKHKHDRIIAVCTLLSKLK